MKTIRNRNLASVRTKAQKSVVIDRILRSLQYDVNCHQSSAHAMADGCAANFWSLSSTKSQKSAVRVFHKQDSGDANGYGENNIRVSLCNKATGIRDIHKRRVAVARCRVAQREDCSEPRSAAQKSALCRSLTGIDFESQNSR